MDLDLGAPETFRWQAAGGILVVTLNRPDRLNALSRQMQLELADFWARVRSLPSLRCVVLTGAGRAFCAGADMADLASGTRPSATIGLNALNFCPSCSLDIPVILAINGPCVGGGLNLLAGADIAIASEEAWFADPHVSMGQVSGPEVLQLVAKVSFAAVAQLALSGSKFRMSAQRALAVNLVSEVVPPDRLLDRAREIAEMVAAQSPTAVRATLAILRRRAREPIRAELEAAWAAVVRQWSHPDAMEGPSAFAERRAPRWSEPETRVAT